MELAVCAGDQQRINDQVVLARALLRPVFQLIPVFAVELPGDISDFALFLHRQMQVERTLTDAEELAGHLAPEHLVPSEESVESGLFDSLVQRIEEMQGILNESIPLDSVIKPLAVEIAT
jgi:hypothetical protein